MVNGDRYGRRNQWHRSTFQIQQPPLAFDTATVARKFTVGPDNSVARHDDRERVASVGQTDCADRGWLVDAPGEFAIGNRDAVRDSFERLPDSALERRTANGLTVDADTENRPPTGEILFELSRDLGEESVSALPSVALCFRRTVTMVFHEDPGEPTLGSAEAEGAEG